MSKNYEAEVPALLKPPHYKPAVSAETGEKNVCSADNNYQEIGNQLYIGLHRRFDRNGELP